MKKKNITLSIIIVNYHAKKVLFDCLRSIEKSKSKTSYEIIIVDNDEVRTIDKDLKKLSPEIVYVKSPANNGYGSAFNLGAAVAKGKYLLLVNPDVLILGNPIDELYTFITKKNNVGLVAALMVDTNKEPYFYQGTKRLTPFNVLFTYSLFHKLFPNNPIAKDFWRYKKETEEAIESPNVPYGVAIIEKSLFEKVGKFDENFFLYYEDFDLSKRVEDSGYKNYLLPWAKIIHLGGKGGTAEVKNINKVYRHSEFLYFEKHYGTLTAYITTTLLNIGKVNIFLTGVLCLSAFLLFDRLNVLMSFFGDQGWFYLSARDMLLDRSIPLVGIASSHPWLHQGPMWTYLLGIIFSLTHFNPLAPGYIFAGVGVITVGLVYLFGKRMFSISVGLIVSFLYATSPLVLITTRSPYQTNLIPILVLIFMYFFTKWLSGNTRYFPWVIFLLACLYNFEIATTPFTLIVILCLLFGLWKKKKYVTELAKKKIIVISFFAWLFPMIPMLLYDIHHGFPQTVKFVLWLGYRFARLFGFPDIHGDTTFEPLAPFLPFTLTKIQDLLFLPQQNIAVLLFVIIFLSMTYFVYRDIKKKKFTVSLISLYITFTIPFLGYLALKTSSEAYWPMFFPAIMLALAYVIDRVLFRKRIAIVGILVVLLIGVLNAYTLVKNNYLMSYDKYGYPFSERLTAAHQIITQAKGRKYTIIGKGEGSKFASFTMPYTYLTWWIGHGPSTTSEKVKILVSETPQGIQVKEIKK